jgi:hypothetical protein
MATNLWTNVEELGDYAGSTHSYEACKTASYMLWALSGRKFTGITTVTERYVCASNVRLLGASAQTYTPALVEGSVFNIPLGDVDRFGAEFSMESNSARSRLRLRGRRVVDVHNVRTLRGDLVDPMSYRLVEHSTLEATYGKTFFPCNVEVTYTYGAPPPAAGRLAARTLALELVKLYENDQDCALPNRVTSVARQGVTYTVLDNQDFIDELRSGIYAVDLFLRATNPDRARARARVFSPDVPRARRVNAKPFVLPQSTFDIAARPSQIGTRVIQLDDVSGQFLLSDNSWDLEVRVTNWAGTSTTALTSAATLDTVGQTVTVSVTYAEAKSTLGLHDPGTWDLYVSRPTPNNPSVDEVINLVSGNLSTELAESTEPVYTL